MGAGQVIIILLAVLGLCALMQLMLHMLYRSGKDFGTLVLVLHLSGHREDIEYELRCARDRLRETEGFEQKRLLLVDDGMDSETRELCRCFLYKTPGVSYCSREEFANMQALQYTEID
ncbi:MULTISPECIES: hypothetical protein [Caproicibacterium]|jgi:hypothetical protein|uniref:Glycosyltransferase 2-like domain-containing protein n=1 Tax=Caproicibacterium lactatifermentans TaxID=2666138 RepID=A0A859DRX4_9FIRM|nr:hypothetical protein [Caproicibacterium lactatifermentans]ARP49849.1 hypothetical protein B6259_02425 [Ruminococcaceae bacterium CPB6]MDD4807202.1 hypothetical protein [Oscillospiraceae bacterium]QKN24424.1 hypothetical protein GJQ69_08015 [Caproicibacterium lactatifermentans]QKO30563.1 hypothetical protein GKP14_05790 [Caproicibacterium lactatifermentans]